MKYVAQILIPKKDNQGVRFSKSKYATFHARMMQRFRGWSRKGQVEGAWSGLSGRIIVDIHWVYEIEHARRQLSFWEEEKERLKEEFEQEEIRMMQYEGRRI
jgi:hypothetical protein